MHRNKIKTKTKTIKSATVVTHKITLFYYIIIISSTLLTTKQKRIGAKTKKNEREKKAHGNTYTYEREKTAKFAIMKNGEENNNKKFKNYKRTYKTEKERNGIANCKMHAIDEKRYC